MNVPLPIRILLTFGLLNAFAFLAIQLSPAIPSVYWLCTGDTEKRKRSFVWQTVAQKSFPAIAHVSF